MLHSDVERVAFGLKKGELSAVLSSAEGFTILRCDDIYEGRVIPLDEARATIRQGLWSRASLARQAGLRAELLQEAAPRYADAVAGDEASAADFQGGRITVAQLRWLAGASLDTLSLTSRRALLEEQIVRELAAARARARGLDRDAALQARRRWQRARLLATDEIARRINESLAPPTDAEMRAHYERHRERYVSPVQVDVGLIQWTLDPANPQLRFAEAEAVLARLRAGELEFDQAARQVSTHASAAQGGRLGLLAMPELAYAGPNVFRTAEGLSPGQTSGVVQQDQRLYLVKLWERRPSRPLRYEEAATQVEQELGNVRVAALQKERNAAALEALKLEVLPQPPDPAP